MAPNSCIGESCKFCEWRRQNPISLGWESLFECDKKIGSQAVQTRTKSLPIESSFHNEDLVTLDEAVLTALDEIDILKQPNSLPNSKRLAVTFVTSL